MSASDETTRRDVLRAGVAMASAIVTPALADELHPTSEQGHASPSSDPNPVTKYPRPPFPKQQQPWPGLHRR